MTFKYQLPKRVEVESIRMADKELRAQHASWIFDDGDPNHPKFNKGINYATCKPVSLFGYAAEEFMKKQYR